MLAESAKTKENALDGANQLVLSQKTSAAGAGDRFDNFHRNLSVNRSSEASSSSCHSDDNSQEADNHRQ